MLLVCLSLGICMPSFSPSCLHVVHKFTFCPWQAHAGLSLLFGELHVSKMKQNILTAKKVKNLQGNEQCIPPKALKHGKKHQWLWEQTPQHTAVSLNFRIKINTSFYQHRSKKTNQINKKHTKKKKNHKPPTDWLIQQIRTFMSAAVHKISVKLLTYGNKEWHNTLE